MKKVTITENQVKQFNVMRNYLLRISKGYSTTSQLKKESRSDYGLDYEEVLEMAYENMQGEARLAVRGVKAINYTEY